VTPPCFPLDPTTICAGVQVDVATSGACRLVILKGNFLPQNNAHFENHARLYHVGKLWWTDRMAILSMYHLVVTPLDEVIPGLIITVAIDDVVKILHRRDVWSDQYVYEIKSTFHVEQNSVGTGRFRPKWSTTSTLFIWMWRRGSRHCLNEAENLSIETCPERNSFPRSIQARLCICGIWCFSGRQCKKNK